MFDCFSSFFDTICRNGARCIPPVLTADMCVYGMCVRSESVCCGDISDARLVPRAGLGGGWLL